MAERPAEISGPVFFSFYSIKGGVGRSMILANAAVVLARRRGLHVVAVDWDLEAPGLHYYFGLSDEELADRPGLLDFLEDYRAEISKGAEGVFPSPDDYGVEITEPLKGQKAAGTLRLIHCGKRDDRYTARVGAFDWDAFYRDYAGFMGIQMLKVQLRQTADIVLIDSRTGYTDISQVTVLQIPDVVCICFTCNRQNLAETVRMVEFLHQNRAERERRNLGRRQVLLIPSRVPVTQEPGLYEEWLDEATEAFDRLVELGAVGRDAHPNKLETTLVPLETDFSFFEDRLPVSQLWETNTPSQLAKSMDNVSLALFNLSQSLPIWQGRQFEAAEHVSDTSRSVEAAAALSGERIAELEDRLGTERERLKGAIDREDKVTEALSRYLIGGIFLDLRRLREAEDSFERSLALNREAEYYEGIAANLIDIGSLRVRGGKLKEAWRLFEESLALLREIGHVRGQAITHCDMGRLRAGEGKVDEAWGLYEKALALTREAGEIRGHGITLHEMGLLRVGEGKVHEAWNLFNKSLALQRRQAKVQDESRLAVRPDLLLAGNATVEEVRKYFEESQALNPELGETARSRSVTIYWMGRVFERNGHPKEALDAYEDALEWVRKTNAPDLIEILTQSIRGVKKKLKK